MTRRFRNNLFWMGIALAALAGCARPTGNVGRMQSYPVPAMEAEWIRNGQPIEFEDELWFPVDDYETLTDSEVYLISQFQGVQVFVEKIDVRPFERLYTKLDVNKFRIYERNDD